MEHFFKTIVYESLIFYKRLETLLPYYRSVGGILSSNNTLIKILLAEDVQMVRRFLILLLATSLFSSGYAQIDKNEGISIAEKLQDTFANVAEKALPAVVIIKTSRRIKQYYYLNPGYDSFSYRFFRRPRQILERESQPIPSGQASGFILNEKGYILTNYHVVKDQSDFKIAMLDGDEYNAKIVGVDPETDIAVLKIKTAKKLPFLKFADLKTVKVGHYAIAIGAPFGLNHTVTVGTVSFKGRSTGMNFYENYIQTDAAINPGNSGGPLLNLKGEVIGVNDFILSPPGSQGNIGLGFAISGKLAEHVAKQLISKGKAEKPWIGIAMQDNTTLSTGNNRPGVMIVGILKESPAEKACLKVKDVILKIDKEKITKPDEINRIIATHLPGDNISLEIERDEKTIVKMVELGSRPEQLFRHNMWMNE